MNRRQFLAAGSAFAIATLPRRLTLLAQHQPMPPVGDPRLKALAHAGLDAASAAGARYADVIFTATRLESWDKDFNATNGSAPWQRFTYRVGVRALVGGCWGMTGRDGVVTMDDMVGLGREAAAQAAIGAKAGAPAVELAPSPPVADGHWVTPIERDPFTVSPEEKLDFLVGVNDFIARLTPAAGRIYSNVRFIRTDTTMASTEGADHSQTTYTSGGSLQVAGRGDCLRGPYDGDCIADFLTPAGAGWEYVRAAPFRESARSLIDTANRTLGGQSVEPGQYDVVFDAYAVASLLSATLGAATSLDRAMGITSQGVGTSFLSDPLGMLGRLQVAAPSITVMANRSMPRGAATVAWDAEGVVPSETVLVKDGVLSDFQNTRESATWLDAYYRRAGRAVRSNGCAGPSGLAGLPSQCPANLSIKPGREALSFEDLVKGTKRGYAICGAGRLSTDWQALACEGSADRMYVIRGGQLGESVNVGQIRYQLSTPEFWKSIVALGGAASARAFGIERDGPGSAHTVVAVPAKATRVRVVNAPGSA